MSTLFIKQTHKDGFTRTWRVQSQQSPFTFGSSRLAKLTSLSLSAPPIEGVFEYNAEQWHWIDMSDNSLSKPSSIVLKISDTGKIKMHDSEVEFYFSEKPLDLHTKLIRFQENQNGSSKTNEKVLELAQLDGKILSLEVRDLNKATPSKAEKIKQQFTNNNIQIIQKTIHAENTKNYTSTPFDKQFDKESRRGLLITGVFGVLIFGLALFSPKPDQLPVAASIQQRVTNLTLQQVPPKNRKNKDLAQKSKPTDKPEQQAAGGKNVVNTIKSISSGRLSKLLGKVAMHTTATKNVIVTRGVASIENTGTALAAIGKVDKSGVDWGSAIKGSGSGVSTFGNGKGVGNGYGQLSAGKTGQGGGVGLIEDESEISGGLDRDVIAQVIKSYLGQILYCYERQLSASPDLYGKVAVRFTINAQGQVEASKIGDTTLKNAIVEGCMLKKIAGWKFPLPNGGTKVVVTYPFLFKSTN